MANKLCCILNAAVQCKECSTRWCDHCWSVCSHVDQTGTRPRSWGICPAAPGKTIGWNKLYFRKTEGVLTVSVVEKPYDE